MILLPAPGEVRMPETLGNTRKTKLKAYLRLYYFLGLQIDSDLKEAIYKSIGYYCARRKHKLININITNIYTEVVFEYSPMVSAMTLIIGLKTTTSRYIREQYPAIRKHKTFWVDNRRQSNKSYVFISLNGHENAPDLTEATTEFRFKM